MHVFFSPILDGPSEDTEQIEILRFYPEALATRLLLNSNTWYRAIPRESQSS